MSTALAAAFLTTLAPFSAPDRSGEAALKELLSSMATVRGARIVVSQSSRETDKDDFFAGNQADILWDGPKRFRFALSNMWGDGSLFVGRETETIRDPLDLSQAMTIRDLGETVNGSVPELALKGDWQVVLVYFLDGAKSLDKLAPADSSVRVAVADRAIEIDKSPFGKLTVYWARTKGRLLVDRLEFDNWDSKVEVHKKYPDWVDMPQKGTLDVESIRYLGLGQKFDNRLFETKPPKGMSTTDERKKKPI